jgi:cytosine deaminase
VFPAIPKTAYRLINARLPRSVLPDAAGTADFVVAEIDIAGGTISGIAEVGAPRNDGVATVDLDGGMVWPACIELHTHLDKGHTLPRAANARGTHDDALEAVAADRAHWSAEDVAARMDFALRCAYAYGTSAIRTHIDSFPPQAEISWPAFTEMKRKWAGRVELQGSCLVHLPFYDTPDAEKLADLVAAHGGVLGVAAKSMPGMQKTIDRLFELARDRDLDIDIHADETADPLSNNLEDVAEAAMRYGWEGRVVAGHCCSLAQRTDAEAAQTIAKVRDAGITVVALPICNMYLQGRGEGRTPRWRGVTLMQELAVAGVPVAMASDNTRDPFHFFGDLDPVEVFTQAVRIAHLDLPFAPWLKAITSTPAKAMRLDGAGSIRVGGAADLILFRARDWSELLARPRAPRLVIRNGEALDAEVPDYRELDGLFAKTA